VKKLTTIAKKTNKKLDWSQEEKSLYIKVIKMLQKNMFLITIPSGDSIFFLKCDRGDIVIGANLLQTDKQGFERLQKLNFNDKAVEVDQNTKRVGIYLYMLET
jgi:hypothetical protein